MNKPCISIILCTHNPRMDYLEETLGGLRRQNISSDRWELLVIDNASREPLEGRIDIHWHPHARVIREEETGLVPARLRGFREAGGDVFVCLDDDVILKEDYLTEVERIGREYPNIGFWGTQIRPRFEAEPDFPLWFYGNAERRVESDRWGNVIEDYASTPWGAGSCIRRAVAERYAALLEADPRRRGLGRTGTRRLSCEDMDMAWVCCRMGLGKGIFKSLELTHLIPREKMTWEAVVRNHEGNVYSYTIHNYLVEGRLPERRSLWKAGVAWIRDWLRGDRYLRAVARAQRTMSRSALADMRAWGWR